MSNTTLFFDQGEYYHTKDDLIIKDVTNISLIGTPSTSNPTSPASIIRCWPDCVLYFYNVTNLLIKYLQFKGCGTFLPEFIDYIFAIMNIYDDYLAAIYVHYCTDVNITNTYIHNQVGYGIFAFNMMGENSLENVTIIMGRQGKHSWCSFGLHYHYGDEDGSAIKADKESYVNIDNIALIDDCESCSCNSNKAVLDLVLNFFSVFISIENSNFTNWKVDENIHIDIASSSDITISFYECI